MSLGRKAPSTLRVMSSTRSRTEDVPSGGGSAPRCDDAHLWKPALMRQLLMSAMDEQRPSGHAQPPLASSRA